MGRGNNADRRVRESDHRVRIILEAGEVQAAGIDLGQLEILNRADDMSVVSHLGPDLLGEDWDPQTAAANLSNGGSDLERNNLVREAALANGSEFRGNVG